MSVGTSQATSRDWLAGTGNIRFSASNFVESMTLSLAESQSKDSLRPNRLFDLGELSLEFRLWDDLSDEAIRKFEEIL
jgi:hypothetical protein